MIVALVPLVVVILWRAARWLVRPPRPLPVVGSPPVPSRAPRRGAIDVRRLVVVAVTVVALAVGGPLPALAAATAGVGVLPRWQQVRAARSRRRLVATDGPDAVDLLVALLHAGLTPVQAVPILAERAPPSWRPGWAAVHAARGRGERFADALEELGTVLGAPALDVIEALTAAERYGHPLGPVLERLAAESRAARRRHAEADARRLPVRLSFPLVCCTLPAFVLLTIAPLVAGAFRSLTLPGGHP